MSLERPRKETDDAYADLIREFPDLFLYEDTYELSSYIPPGWREIARTVARQLTTVVSPFDMDIKINRLRDKDGALIVQVSAKRRGSEAPREILVLQRIKDLIAIAAEESRETCQTCGKSPATLFRVFGQLETLCDEHGRKRGSNPAK